MAENEINLLNQKKTSDPKLRELEEKLILEPQKNEIRFDLAELQFNNGIHLEAIENCLDVLIKKQNKNN